MTDGPSQEPLPGFPGLLGPDGRLLRHWRERDGAGKSPESHRKHARLWQLCSRAVAIESLKFAAKGRGVVIDTNAGDGDGVALPQPDMFEPEKAVSLCTPRMALELGKAYGLDVYLAEKNRTARDKLLRVCGEYPGVEVTIVGDHAELPALVGVRGYLFGVAINDPNGPATQGVGTLAELTRLVPRLDVALTLNVGAIIRHAGLGPVDPGKVELPGVVGARATRERYLWMLEPVRWWPVLRKRYLFRTRVSPQSGAFRPRVMLWSDYGFPGRFRSGPFEAIDLFEHIPPQER